MKSEKYAIGLDIGTGIGWAIIGLNEKEEPSKIIDLGVYCFDKSEDCNSKLLNVKRREARSTRRVISRRKLRKKELYKIIEDNIPQIKSTDFPTIINNTNLDPYKLRAEALDRKLSSEELIRVLIHISQRRGFKSNRIHEQKNDDGLLLTAVNDNKKRMEEHDYRTVGEMYYKDPIYSQNKRNGNGEYISTVSRELLIDEIKTIFDSQRRFGNTFATPEFEENFLSRYSAQRNFDEGPGIGSPRYGNQIAAMVGKCTFFPEEDRAAAACFSNEYRNLLQTINNIGIYQNGEKRKLTDEERIKVINFALTHKTVTYKQVRKELQIENNCDFTISYNGYENRDDAESKTKITALKHYQELKGIIEKELGKDYFKSLSEDILDDICTVLSLHKTDATIKNGLEERDIPVELIEISDLFPSFDRFANLSLKACKMIIPHLEKGMTYDKACIAAGFDNMQKNTAQEKLHITDDELIDITSPVAKTAIIRTSKIINAIIDKMGRPPVYINIETTRDISCSKKTRAKIEKNQRENMKENDEAREFISETFHMANPSHTDVIKYKLWREQEELCIYSSEKIPASILFTSACEIDHIVPYSISFDDSFDNKVLVFKKENQQKGNRLPMQYLTGSQKDAFLVNVERLYKGKRTSKKLRLFKEHITDEDVSGFKRRNLQDTSLTATFIANYLKDHLIFDESSTGRKIRVNTVSGKCTAILRSCWRIRKDRSESDKHHAADAVVIGCVTNTLIKRVSDYNRYRETRYSKNSAEEDGFVIKDGLICDALTGEVVEEMPLPWERINDDIRARLSDDPVAELQRLNLSVYNDDYSDVKPVIVCRMVRHNVTGSAHKDTIMSKKYIEDGYAIKKVPLTALKLDVNGEIKDYFRPQDDKLLYEALKERLATFNGNAEKAFAEPFYKPKADGTRGPSVKKVKTKETMNSYVLVNNGVAGKKSMVRIDVFKTEKGYDAVPIYVCDIISKNRPLVSPSGQQLREENFLFSLYKNDYILIETKKTNGIAVKVNYLEFDVESSRIKVYKNDQKQATDRHSIRSAKLIKKLYVDLLGEVHEVKKEKRI